MPELWRNGLVEQRHRLRHPARTAEPWYDAGHDGVSEWKLQGRRGECHAVSIADLLYAANALDDRAGCRSIVVMQNTTTTRARREDAGVVGTADDERRAVPFAL